MASKTLEQKSLLVEPLLAIIFWDLHSRKKAGPRVQFIVCLSLMSRLQPCNPLDLCDSFKTPGDITTTAWMGFKKQAKTPGCFGWKLHMYHWRVVEPTHRKNMSQNGNLPQIRLKIKDNLKPPPRSLLLRNFKQIESSASQHQHSASAPPKPQPDRLHVDPWREHQHPWRFTGICVYNGLDPFLECSKCSWCTTRWI